MHIVGVLDDYPTDSGGLTSQELKDKFDEGGLAIKEYVNEELIPAIGSANIPFTPTAEIVETTVQEAIENVQRQISSAIAGSLPNNSVSFDKLTDAVKTRIASHETEIERLDAYIPTINASASSVAEHEGKITTLESASAAHEAGIEANASAIATKSDKTVSNTYTLTAAGWSGNAQTVTVSGADGKTAVVGIDSETEEAEIRECQRCRVRVFTQIGNDITFNCSEVPTADIKFNVLILD